jgi:hypothetical protein
MALTIDPALKRVTIPQSDLTFVSGTLYSFDTEQFMRDLNALLDDEDYIWMDTAFNHNTEQTILGTTYARSITMINGWSITFENVGMTVQYGGSNNDLFDSENGILINQPLVNVVGNNAAGLVVTGSALTGDQSTQLQEIHRDMGLDSSNPVTITENVQGDSYDQDSTGIAKEIRTSGSTKTVTRV